MEYPKILDLKEEIGKRIRTIRGEIKQKDFAKLVGIHKNQLNRYENGKSLPRAEIRKRIAVYAMKKGFSSEWLFTGEEKRDRIFTRVGKHRSEYRFENDSTKILLDNVKEILESGNDTMADTFRSNIKAFLEAVRTSKKNSNKKGEGGHDEKN